MKKKVFWLVLGLAVLGGGIYFLQNQSAGEEKSYKNSTYGYSFSYGPEVVLAEESPEAVGLNGAATNFWVYHVRVKNNEKNLSMDFAVEDWRKNRVAYSQDPKEEHNFTVRNITIDGEVAKYVSVENVNGYGNAAVIILKDNLIYILSGDDSTAETKAGFEDFISTFQFN